MKCVWREGGGRKGRWEGGKKIDSFNKLAYMIVGSGKSELCRAGWQA